MIFKNHRSYHGSIKGTEAFKILERDQRENCFLTRYSEVTSGFYITTKVGQRNGNYLIEYCSKLVKFKIEKEYITFANLDDMFDHYKNDGTLNIGDPVEKSP